MAGTSHYNLSEFKEALVEFTAFFLDTCLDQVRFMEGLMEPNRLRVRVLLWAEEEARAGELPLKAGRLLEALLYRGELPRGEVPALLEMGDLHTRRSVSALVDRGVVRSESSRAPLRLALPAMASRWFPGLFPGPGPAAS